MSLSIIIPCRNEEETIESTIRSIKNGIGKKILNYDIILINDFSNDKTKKICLELSKTLKYVCFKNNKKKGLGGAINLGINTSRKKFICIMMADLSDSHRDLVRYYKIMLNQNCDAVLGSRFIKNSKVYNYPLKKLIFNRIFNYIVKIIFISNYNDFTNAFKMYKRETILNVRPLISENFNIFLEIPLKIIIRKMNYKIIPISWRNRKKGKAKFKIKELSSKYLFTLLYCFFEKTLLKR